MTFYPFEGRGCRSLFEEICCSFEELGILYTYPAIVLPFPQVFGKAVNHISGVRYYGQGIEGGK